MEVVVVAGSREGGSWRDGRGAEAYFCRIGGVAVDREGNIIVADSGNNCIRKIFPDGNVITLAGSGRRSWGDGHGTQAHFSQPFDVAVDGEGNIVVADRGNNCIRKISPDGYVSTVAGSGSESSGDGHGTQADFSKPCSVAMDGDGNIIVAETFCMRKISRYGNVTTLANTLPCDIFIKQDGEGNIIVLNADRGEPIRKIGSDGEVSTFSFNDDYFVHGFTVDGEGNIIVMSDNVGGFKIDKISPDGNKSIIWSSEDVLERPSGIAVDNDGNIIIADDNVIQKISAGLVPLAIVPTKLPCLPSAFASQMEELLHDGPLSDVTFVVGGARIKAHRAILVARSEYFRAMLMSGFMEGQEVDKEITISGTTPEAFKFLLRYLYTDELHFTEEHLFDVMCKAKETSLERVYNHLARRFSDHITVHNVVVWFAKADEYELEDMRSATLRFLTRNLHKVKAEAKQSLQILLEKPHLMMELIMEAI